MCVCVRGDVVHDSTTPGRVSETAATAFAPRSGARRELNCFGPLCKRHLPLAALEKSLAPPAIGCARPQRLAPHAWVVGCVTSSMLFEKGRQSHLRCGEIAAGGACRRWLHAVQHGEMPGPRTPHARAPVTTS